jgi:hypothetical protein
MSERFPRTNFAASLAEWAGLSSRLSAFVTVNLSSDSTLARERGPLRSAPALSIEELEATLFGRVVKWTGGWKDGADVTGEEYRRRWG